MKKLAVAAMLLAAALALTGCENTVPEGVDAPRMSESPFATVYRGFCYKVLFDRETKVMYTMSNGSYNAGNFTMLRNADGTPRLWEGEEK